MLSSQKKVLALSYLLIMAPTTIQSQSQSHSCVQEFEPCVMNRDCCEHLSCITGDWQFTTDSTCLSKRSEEIDHLKLTIEEKMTLVEGYYNHIGSNGDNVDVDGQRKSRKDVEKIVRKYDLEFPKLVSRLEQKYGILLDFDNIHMNVKNKGHDEL